MGVAAAAPPGGAVPELAGTKILFDGVAAALVSVSETRCTVVVPYSVDGRSSTQVVAQFQGRPSAAVALPVAPSSPGLFSADATGTGQGAIQNEDGAWNSPGNPAPAGSIVVLYGTGEGQTDPSGVEGLTVPRLAVAVTIAGLPAELLYAGSVPGIAGGVFQVNARVPLAAPSGSVPVVVTIGRARSQPNLTVAVRE
jgi:uncharacterized protein (TIGR03437 family)